MDYLRTVKDEVAKIKIDTTSEKVTELAGFIRINSKILLTQGTRRLQVYTENASVARRMLTFLKMFTHQIHSSTVNREGGRLEYQFEITDEYAIRDIFHDTDFIADNIFARNYDIAKHLVPDDDHVRAYIRGAFLAGGRITDPNKAYHVEIQTGNIDMAQSLQKELKKLHIPSKISSRRDVYFLYIKESNLIGDFLFNIGATSAYLGLQDVMVFKDVRNKINRLVNSETANINKTVTAAMRQIEDINYLIDVGVFEDLDPDVQSVARLRLDNPEASLSEISKMSQDLSRSAINYRLQKIKDTADKLRGAR